MRSRPLTPSLSYMEQRLTLARILLNFDMELADGAHEWDTEGNMKNIKAYSTWQKPPLNIKLVDRKLPTSKHWKEQSEKAAARA